MVTWVKIMCMYSSFRMLSESADLDDTSITHKKGTETKNSKSETFFIT
jgi:hypothetical protein